MILSVSREISDGILSLHHNFHIFIVRPRFLISQVSFYPEVNLPPLFRTLSKAVAAFWFLVFHGFPFSQRLVIFGLHLSFPLSEKKNNEFFHFSQLFLSIVNDPSSLSFAASTWVYRSRALMRCARTLRCCEILPR